MLTLKELKKLKKINVVRVVEPFLSNDEKREILKATGDFKETQTGFYTNKGFIPKNYIDQERLTGTLTIRSHDAYFEGLYKGEKVKTYTAPLTAKNITPRGVIIDVYGGGKIIFEFEEGKKDENE